MGCACLPVNGDYLVDQHGASGRYDRQKAPICDRFFHFHPGFYSLRRVQLGWHVDWVPSFSGDWGVHDDGPWHGHRHGSISKRRAWQGPWNHRGDGFAWSHCRTIYWRDYFGKSKLALALFCEYSRGFNWNSDGAAICPLHPAGWKTTV